MFKPLRTERDHVITTFTDSRGQTYEVWFYRTGLPEIQRNYDDRAQAEILDCFDKHEVKIDQKLRNRLPNRLPK
jgi:hypothetical protein